MINPDDEMQADKIVELLSTTEEERRTKIIVDFLRNIVEGRGADFDTITEFYENSKE